MCERITRELGLEKEVSRHTLLAYKDIEIAFNTRKAMLKEAPQKYHGTEDDQLKNAYKRIDELETNNKRLHSEVSAMREQIIRWMYNLYQMGHNMDEMNAKIPENVDIEELKDRALPRNVDPESLNRPLPKITRADDRKRKRSRDD
ncbi:hypothetical protein [Pseudoalteromonas issachenkonii]|uniref:hypothetical protein n=1 Tax=Pseudoalteromonas issachenkonii TaxID=152297 RepID=UPI001E320B47|nr:hypothetical protein [Pseudoalteromonas issachenkonii]